MAHPGRSNGADVKPSAGSGPPSSGSGRIFLRSGLKETLTALREAHISLPPNPVQAEFSIDSNRAPWDRPLFELIETVNKVQLESANGLQRLLREPLVAAYDESIRKFAALEGTAYLASHSLVVSDHNAYVPQVLLSFHFYTKAKDVANAHPELQYSENPTRTSEEDYMDDRIWFLKESLPRGALLFVDGPLIAGDAYTRMISAIPELHARDVLPVFVVKNSESDMVIRNLTSISGRYNSDLHWANHSLGQGERTPLFRYTDQHNPKNSKVFCYLKALYGFPLRIEFHPTSLERFRDRALGSLDIANYLALAQGDNWNPQLRYIAVAEMFARSAIRLIDVNRFARGFHLTPTIDQTRFGG